MNDIDAKIVARMERLRGDITAAMASNNINATGRTSDSLQVQVYDEGVRLLSVAGDHAPLQTVEIGREGGNVPKRFYLILKDWSIAKGIQFATDRERSTFAYFLGKKIAREGTQRHKSHVDIYSTLTTEAANEIKGMILASVREMIKTNF